MMTEKRERFGTSIRVRNVNEALFVAMDYFRADGQPRASRNGPVLRMPGFFSTTYDRPMERVLFDRHRDANPFFHLMESMWILAGSNNAALPSYYLKKLLDYSDNGHTFHGAYGYRLRQQWGFDQIEQAVKTLTIEPFSRQVVLSIWDPNADMGRQSKDIPCNDMVMLEIDDGKLNMLVCNRSNDLIWGAYGANVVQFSILLEYIARRLDLPVGQYTQMSNNTHIYEDNRYWQLFQNRVVQRCPFNPYELDQVAPIPLALNSADAVLLWEDCVNLDMAATRGDDLTKVSLGSSFGMLVLDPAILAYEQYKQRNISKAIDCVYEMPPCDWRMAMIEWLERRI